MRKKLAIGAALVLLVAVATPAAAAKPDAGCPSGPSAYILVDQQAWWDATVAGFETAGIPVYVGGDPENGFTTEFDAFGAAYGLGDGQGVYDFVWGPQWEGIDKNDDLLVCMKPRPINPGNLGYNFGGVDNTAR